MKILPRQDYVVLTEGALVIEADLHGAKVLSLADGTMLKLFRSKRWLSSATWYPYAQRFADNCAALAAQHVPCPRVNAVFRLPHIARDAVLYQPLAGKTIRQKIAEGMSTEESSELRALFARLVRNLHGKGIYFRSLHLGNVVLTPEGDLGLIDVADLSFKRGSLGSWACRRNMKHVLRNRADAEWLGALTASPSSWP